MSNKVQANKRFTLEEAFNTIPEEQKQSEAFQIVVFPHNQEAKFNNYAQLTLKQYQGVLVGLLKSDKTIRAAMISAIFEMEASGDIPPIEHIKKGMPIR